MRISPQSRAYASATRLCIELSHTPVHLIHLHSSPHLPAFRSLAVLLSLQTSAKTLGQRRLAAAHVKVKAPLLCQIGRAHDVIHNFHSTAKPTYLCPDSIWTLSVDVKMDEQSLKFELLQQQQNR